MLEFRFVYPIVFLIYVPVCLVVLAWVYRYLHISPATIRYSDTRLLQDLPSSWRLRFRLIPDILRFIAWAVLAIALARPQIGNTREILRGQGIDMILALDISGSMDFGDFQPNRLEAAKTVIRNFISGREFDRIGLVVFASNAYYQSPPTLDYDNLQSLVSKIQLARELNLEDKTAIGLGIGSAANLLRHSTGPTKVIILLTDGANNSGTIDPVTAAEAAQVFNIRIYTIGMGQPGTTTLTDANGDIQIVESDLDEDTLKAIAANADGNYFRANDLSDLQRIYDQIDRLERSEVEKILYVRWQDVVWPWLVGGLILLIIERILRLTLFQTLL